MALQFRHRVAFRTTVTLSHERAESFKILFIFIHVIHRIIPACVHSCTLDTARTIASTLHAFKFELMNLTLRTMTHFTFSGVVSKHVLLNQRLPLEMIILFDSHGRRFLLKYLCDHISTGELLLTMIHEFII